MSAKKVIPLIIFSLVLHFSCSDNPVSETINYNLISSLNAEINGLPHSVVIKAVVTRNTIVHLVNTDTIINDSAMNIDLTVPPNQYLIDIDQFLTSAGGTTVITDHEAKVNTLNLEVHDSSNTNIGFIYKDNHDTTYELFPGFVNISALYSDRGFSVTGRSIEVSGSDTTIMAYNAVLGNGWNVVTTRVKDVRKGFIEFEFFNGEYPPSGADWHYYPNNLNKPDIFLKIFGNNITNK